MIGWLRNEGEIIGMRLAASEMESVIHEMLLTSCGIEFTVKEKRWTGFKVDVKTGKKSYV